MQFIWSLVGAVLSAIVFPFIYPFIEDPILSFIAKTFGTKRLKKTHSLRGKWVQTWHVQSENFPDKNTLSIELYQIGSKVYGYSEKKGKTLYYVSGNLKDRFFTGIWEDHFDDVTFYHGAFQLEIKVQNHSKLIMSGTWVGFSSKGGIKSGNWVWEKTEDPQV